MDMEELLSKGEYRRNCYRVLADCYYLPDEGLIRTLNGLEKSSGNLQFALAESAPTPNAIEELTIDYSRLFIGPFKLLAPPYGSIYLENTARVMGDSTQDVKKRYAEEGLQVDLKEAPDHIAIELEFMYYLISKEVAAVLNGDTINATGYLRKQRDFLAAHLGIWLPDFAGNVSSNAETAFYRKLAGLTDSFVKEDLESLSKTLPLASTYA